MQNNWTKAEKILKTGGIVVLPTDTLYGITASVFSKKAIERIHKIKGRSKNKPLITLITSYRDIEKFGIKINKDQKKFLDKNWPSKLTVEFNHSKKEFSLIRNGCQYSGFRMIGSRNKNLFNLIKKVGPIVAPSANPEGQKPAETIKEAKDYFREKVFLYINGGIKKSLPSTLIKFEGNKIVVLRQGIKKIK